ncbi:MAG: hypothetical protein WHV44_03545 [Anaerolineales bacterium]
MNNRIRFTLPLSILAVLALLSMAAGFPVPGRDAPVGDEAQVSIERQADGTSVTHITPRLGGAFTFGVPAGWYPLAFPVTPEEAEAINAVFAANSVPLSIGEEQLSSQGDLGLQLAIFSLDSRHYQNEGRTVILGAIMDVPAFVPDWAVLPIEMLSQVDGVERVAISQIDEQYVASLEYAFDNPERAETLYGSAIMFVRGGQLIALFGATTRPEAAPALNDAIGYIRTTLDFTPTP